MKLADVLIGPKDAGGLMMHLVKKTYFVRLVCNIDILNLGLLLSSTENNKYYKILSRLSFAGRK